MTTRTSAPESAFRAAFQRLCEASTVDQCAEELSNMLHQLYRISEIAKTALGSPTTLYNHLAQVPGGDEAAAMLWARTFDTHVVVEVGDLADVFGDYFTNLFGELVWKQRSAFPKLDEKKYPPRGRDDLYDRCLAGRSVLRTSQKALAALLQVVP